MPLVVGKRITIRGFIVYDPDMGPKYSEEHQSNLQKWIKNGEITIKIDLTDGIDIDAEGYVAEEKSFFLNSLMAFYWNKLYRTIAEHSDT